MLLNLLNSAIGLFTLLTVLTGNYSAGYCR